MEGIRKWEAAQPGTPAAAEPVSTQTGRSGDSKEMVMTLIALLLVASQAAPSAGSKPDFSAQWVVNASESDFGLIPPPQCRGLKLTHREPELVAEETGPAGEPCGLTIRYSTDGTPVTYTANNARQRAQLTWSC